MGELYLIYGRFVICLLILGISVQSHSQSLEWDYGRNDYEFPLEDVPRHFIVHIPASYTGEVAVPVVFMFHGTNAQGHSFWLDSKWKELAEVENFIAVFPSSWKYLITSDNKVKEKWNYAHFYKDVTHPENLKDDVGFINLVLDRIIETFNIDESRVYASGFSNGAKFVHTRVLPELNHRFAAIGCSAGLMMNKFDISGNLLPTISLIGTTDGKILPAHPDSILPFNIQGILDDPVLGRVIDSTIYSLQLEKEFTVDSTVQSISFHFDKSTSGNDNEWFFVVLNRVPHVYPHGNNNRWNLVAANMFWNYFQNFQVITNTDDENHFNTDPCAGSIRLVNKQLDLSCLFDNRQDKWEALLYSVSGILVKKCTVNDRFLELDNLRSGMYIVSFRNNRNMAFSMKFYLL